MQTLADRMKTYEQVTDSRLTNRVPVILRIDGNSFHNFTRLAKFQRPFDKDLSEMMIATAMDVLRYCSGSTLAYVQSDEISILLRNDQTTRTQPFLANRVQKLVSLVASVATVSFYKSFLEWTHNQHVDAVTHMVDEELPLYAKRRELRPTFDARAFVLPHNDVVNYFVWRQQDAYKNCVSAVAEAVLAEQYNRATVRKMLAGQNTGKRKEILLQHGLDLDVRIDQRYRHGVAIRKAQITKQLSDILMGPTAPEVDLEEEVTRSIWSADFRTPLFKDQREYIESLL